ncbi:MAG TPA: hypothetical protein VK815_08920 [Candidatus Acidoferrales bacterium]|nr:hypothetical protein [Candidatus Acidoferrales bacterium]
MIIGHVALRIHFKGLFDVGCPLTIHNDFLGAVVIQVADGGGAGVFTPPDFFTKPALGVFRKGINVVFAETKIIVEHQFSLRRVLKPRAGEFERLNDAGVQHVNDPSAVHAVAGEAVGVPREYAIRFSGLYAL